jgi:ATP-dependent Clp protease ATP-binding subunit ClpX
MQVEDVIADLVFAADQILDRAGVERSADDDLNLARRGIVFIDEFDKIRQAEGSSRNYGKDHIQRRLLKMVEGSSMSVGQVRHNSDAVRRTLDTSGVLFIACGAFEGIGAEHIRAARPDALQNASAFSRSIISIDIVNYGIIPELVARLEALIAFDRLTTDELLAILRNPAVSPIEVWRHYFRTFGKALRVQEGALCAVAERAELLGLGARGLQEVLFPLLSAAALSLEASTRTAFTLREKDVAAR